MKANYSAKKEAAWQHIFAEFVIEPVKKQGKPAFPAEPAS